MNIRQLTLLSALSILSINACKNGKKESVTGTAKIPGIVLENMDTTVSPKDNFYDYVNGNWMRTNTIPDDETRWEGLESLESRHKKMYLTL